MHTMSIQMQASQDRLQKQVDSLQAQLRDNEQVLHQLLQTPTGAIPPTHGARVVPSATAVEPTPLHTALAVALAVAAATALVTTATASTNVPNEPMASTTAAPAATPIAPNARTAATVAAAPPPRTTGVAPTPTAPTTRTAATVPTAAAPPPPRTTSVAAASTRGPNSLPQPAASNAFDRLQRPGDDRLGYSMSTKATTFYYDCMTKFGGQLPSFFGGKSAAVENSYKKKAKTCLDFFKAMHTDEEKNIMLPPAVSTSQALSAADAAALEGKRQVIATELAVLVATKLEHEFLSRAEARQQPAVLPRGWMEPKRLGATMKITTIESKLTGTKEKPSMWEHLKDPERLKEFAEWRKKPETWKKPR